MTRYHQPLTQDFFDRQWRKAPALFRAAVDSELLFREWPAHFSAWCRPPAQARLFLRTESTRTGSAQAYRLSDPADAPELFDCYADEPLTILLNDVQNVAADVHALRSSLGVGRTWRYDDIVATLSKVDSGIGYHAGHEDSVIVQLSGKRLWRLWPPAVVPEIYRWVLLGYPLKPSEPLTKPGTAPLFECTLEAGDILYIPPLFPHEGVTLEQSVSLSIGWAGISVFRLLLSMFGEFPPLAMEVALNHPEAFFALLDDPPCEAPSASEAMFESIRDRLELLGRAGPSADDVRQFLGALFCGARQLRR